MKVKKAQGLRNVLREHDPAYPPRQFMDPTARAEWDGVPKELRGEIVRAAEELARGTAIRMDQRCGRGKYDMAGFFGLELAREDLYRLECAGNASEAVAAHRRVADLEAKTQQDREDLAAMDGFDAEWIRERVRIEHALREDVIGGIFAICELMKHDPLQLFAEVLAQQPTLTQRQAS